MSVELLIENSCESRRRTSRERIPQAPLAKDLRTALDATAAALDSAIRRFQVDVQRADSPAGFPGPLR